METSSIRIRLTKLGWDLKELPIKRVNSITKERKVALWKVVAYRGTRSIEATGNDIDDAMHNIGKMLGVIPLDSPKTE